MFQGKNADYARVSRIIIVPVYRSYELFSMEIVSLLSLMLPAYVVVDRSRSIAKREERKTSLFSKYQFQSFPATLEIA